MDVKGREIPKVGRCFRIGTVIAGLLLAALAPLAAVNLWLIAQAQEEAIERRAVALRSVASFAAAQYETALRTVDTALAIEQARLAELVPDRAACRDYLRRKVVGHPFLDAAILLSRRGIVLCTSAQVPVGTDLSDRAYFRAALERDDLVVEEPLIARPVNRLVLPVARRLDGAAPGAGDSDDPVMIAATVDLDALTRTIGALAAEVANEAGGEVDVWIVDRRGVVIADRRDPSRRGSVAPFWVPGHNVSAYQEIEPAFGGAMYMLAGSVPLPGHVQVVIGQKLEEVVRKPRERFLISAVAAFLAIVAGLALAYGLVRRYLLRPLRVLQDMALGIRDGIRAESRGAASFIGELEVLRQSFLAMAEVIHRRESALRLRNETLADLASRDPLTGVANRRALDEVLEVYWRDAAAAGEPVSVLFLDVDRFKAYNDSYGHQAGDEVLRRVADALVHLPLRPDDVVARYGGEEFVIALPGTDVAGARAVAERARDAIARMAIPHSGGPNGIVTISIGVATGWPAAGDTQAEIVERADRALYDAKVGGRNQVRVFDAAPRESADALETAPGTGLPTRSVAK